MMNKEKCDPVLGWQVAAHLQKMGVETPLQLKGEPDKRVIQDAFKIIMEELNLDLSDDSLVDTPKRVAKMFVDELYWGLDYDNFPKCTIIENKMKYDEMVLERNITCLSSCEHHFVTIDAKAHVAYIPNKRVLGLSKINRIVDFFARRPQVQERLTEQIYTALSYILSTPSVAVVVEGVHYCVKSRGVRDYSSETTTSRLGGRFKEDPALRAEFMTLITNGK